MEKYAQDATSMDEIEREKGMAWKRPERANRTEEQLLGKCGHFFIFSLEIVDS